MSIMDSSGQSDSSSAVGHPAAALDIYDQLFEMGFVNRLQLCGKNLRCVESEQEYQPEEFTLCASFRFEGMSDPDDSNIIYALEAKDGTRGVIADAFGAYSCPRLARFLDKVADGRSASEIMRSLPAHKTIKIRAC